MFDLNIPPKANCRVLLTYSDGVITHSQIAKEDEHLSSAKAFAEFMHKRGHRLIPADSVNRFNHFEEAINYWLETGDISQSAAQQLKQQFISLLGDKS
ncbi:hypothetical protein [Serratia fonticola]|uniref:hypothetical protein n=1 Tax=Serratia fonticola TaxID=47917 RepID=UPI00192CEA19|nr:hypothetical protein [Serratia fonticola]MBL5827659.1 hypothetical protein [Serratia fonticola]